MLLLPLAVVVGLGLGRLSGGRLAGLTRLRSRYIYVVAAALGAQVVVGQLTLRPNVNEPVRVVIVIASDLLVGLFLFLNRQGTSRGVRCGLTTIAIGWLGNLLPMAIFGGMPVLERALQEAGLARLAVGRGHLGKHLLLRSRAQIHGLKFAMSYLADDIPVRALSAVVSPGDIVMGVGIAVVVAAAMHGREEDHGLSASSPLRGVWEPGIVSLRKDLL